MQAAHYALPVNVVGKVIHQVLAHHLVVGADIQQATAVAQEQCAPGMQQTHLARPGHQAAQVQEIGDYPHKMK